MVFEASNKTSNMRNFSPLVGEAKGRLCWVELECYWGRAPTSFPRRVGSIRCICLWKNFPNYFIASSIKYVHHLPWYAVILAIRSLICWGEQSGWSRGWLGLAITLSFQWLGPLEITTPVQLVVTPIPTHLNHSLATSLETNKWDVSCLSFLSKVR